MAQEFESFHIEHIPQSQNWYVDALDSFTSLALQPGSSNEILIFAHDLFCPKSVIDEVPATGEDFQEEGKEVLEITEGSKLKDWRFPYIGYTLFRYLPEDQKMVVAIKRKGSPTLRFIT